MGTNTLNGINTYADDKRLYCHNKREEIWLDNKITKWTRADNDQELKESLDKDIKIAPKELVTWNS